jgi:Family of unknown function (DUF6152)
MSTVLFCGRQASAHHSFASTYSRDTITIEGRVVEFLFRNPHSVILVEVSSKGLPTVTWAAEWSTAGQLSREGIEKDTLKAGDHLIISGNPSRNFADHRLRIADIMRPSDGWTWKNSF